MVWIAEISLVVGTLSVVLAIALARVWDHFRAKGRKPDQWGLQTTVFLFKDKKLIDATLSAQSLLNHVRAPISEWQRLLSWLELRFSSITWELERNDRPPKVELTSKRFEGTLGLKLVIETLDDNLVRIELTESDHSAKHIASESMSLRAVTSELDLLRDALDHTPTLIWREDDARKITWANASYMEHAEKIHGAKIGWPLPRLMEPPTLAPGSPLAASRAKLEIEGESRWYDCYHHAVGEQTVVYALPAYAAVRAERNLRDFVQTLSMSFAGLHVGIALFDQTRNLQLFNPALLEMADLPLDLLTQRPTIADFFDLLRERRILPEPKDYASWRNQLSNGDRGAELRESKEEWSLVDGRTLRVCGTPLADGAMLFSFEDITDDVAAARIARGELALSESILNAVDDELALIESGVQIIRTNAAFAAHWGQDFDHIDSLLARCADRFESGAALDELMASLASPGADRQHGGHLIALTGQGYVWRLTLLGPDQFVLQLSKSDPLTISADAVALDATGGGAGQVA